MKDKNKQDKQLAAAILLSVDIESNFKLYSYRVIDQEQFLQKQKDLVNFFNKAMKENVQPEVEISEP